MLSARELRSSPRQMSITGEVGLQGKSTNQNQLLKKKGDCIAEVRLCVMANRNKQQHGQEVMVKNTEC